MAIEGGLQPVYTEELRLNLTAHEALNLAKIHMNLKVDPVP